MQMHQVQIVIRSLSTLNLFLLPTQVFHQVNSELNYLILKKTELLTQRGLNIASLVKHLQKEPKKKVVHTSLIHLRMKFVNTLMMVLVTVVNIQPLKYLMVQKQMLFFQMLLILQLLLPRVRKDLL